MLSTAAPGSGKSAFADAFTEYATLRGKRCGYTATTGVAAAHRGITLASFLGLGVHKSGAGEPKEDLEVIEAKLRELLEKDAYIDKVAQHHVCFAHTLFPLPLCSDTPARHYVICVGCQGGNSAFIVYLLPICMLYTHIRDT